MGESGAPGLKGVRVSSHPQHRHHARCVVHDLTVMLK